LPGVQKVREAANKSACLNNLKQLGIAVHLYHDAKQCVPPTQFSIGCQTDFPNWGWLPRLLPYLEHDALARTLDLNDSYSCASQSALRRAVLRVLACPSDARRPSFQTYASYSNIGATGV